MDEVEKFVRLKLPAFFVDQHVKLVVKEALWLSNFYPEADKEVIKVAAWLHDVVHPVSGYKKEDHNIASAKVAKPFLNSINFDKTKLDKVIHCIEAHRTTQPPEPETVEAKIVASADKLVHFTTFDLLQSQLGLEKAIAKIKRDIEAKLMLPEAIDKAKKLAPEIERKYERKIL